MKDAGINTLVDSISGSIAEKIGAASNAKSLAPVEHKLAHFALGCGMGAALGSAEGSKDVLADAITSGAGAVIGECVAEGLVDREQVMREALIETYNEKGAFDQRYCDAIYQAKLRPYIDTGRLVAGAVIAAIGRDPCHAIAAATNALENNFAGPPPEMGGISREILNESGKMTTAVKEALEETIDDIRKNPGEYTKEAAIGSAPYGDIVRKIANGHDVSAIEFGIETGLLFVGSIKGGIKAGGKIAGKLGATYAKKMERGAVKQANHVPASASTKTAKPQGVHNPPTKKSLDSGNAKRAESSKSNKTLPLRQGKPKAANQTTHATANASKKPNNIHSKEQPWKIREGQEWKEKIVGGAQKTGTPGHNVRSYREAISSAKQDDVQKVLLNRGYKKATGEPVAPNRRPDVTIVKKDGKVNSIEVPSKSDRYPELLRRNEEAMNQLPKEMQGKVRLKEIIKEVQ
jgi:hypothetical protein